MLKLGPVLAQGHKRGIINKAGSIPTRKKIVFNKLISRDKAHRCTSTYTPEF